MTAIKDLSFRHRRYRPLKPHGWKSRIDEWETIQWNNTNVAIGNFLGVTYQSVAHQRRKRNIPNFATRGGNSQLYTSYRP